LKAACLALAVAVAAAAAACGGAGGTSDPLADARAKMAASSSARATIAADSTLITVSCEAELDFDRDRSRMTCGPMTGAAATGSSSRTELRMIGDTTYVRLDHDKMWFKVAGTAGELAGLDPRTLLATLQEQSNEVSVVGKEDVRGAETTHYHLVAAAGPPTQTDVWVDGGGLVRRMRSVQSPDSADAIRLGTEFFDFGADLDIEPPPADEVRQRSVERLTTFSEPAPG
jgi:hypothetical protein